jgi:hypothetical protein
MSNITNGSVPVAYEYSTYILGTMFVASEVLPLLKGKSNGLFHALLCLIKGSKCLLDNVEDVLESKIEASKKTADIP